MEWLLDELVDDNDEIVCLRVVDKDSAIAGSASLEQKTYQEEAEKLMKSIEEKNHDNKAISIVLEFAVGKVEKMIMSMVSSFHYNPRVSLIGPKIRLYEPSLLIVGTRGRNLGGILGLLPGSISKYCLQNSPIPVIVVRPNAQRARGKRKRQADRTRQQYRDLLDKSGSEDQLYSMSQETLHASEDEAAAVAAAIGVDLQRDQAPHRQNSSPLVQVQSANDAPLPRIDKVDEQEGAEPENVQESPAETGGQLMGTDV